MDRYWRLALVAAVFSCGVSSDAVSADAPKWGPHIDLEGRWGEGRSLGDVGLFVPLWQSPTSLLFTDIRLKYDNRNSMEGNFGLGLRHMLSSGWNVGTYGYFDRRRSGTGNHFSQATFGVEALSADWDLRANAYIPFGERTRSLGFAGGGTPFAEFANGTIEIVTPGATQRLERALSGVDAEIGWRLPVFSVESAIQLRAYAGGYWFDGGGLLNDVSGPRGRVELSFNDALGIPGARFTLGGEVQRDRLRGTQGYAVARLRIPLQAAERDAPKLTAQEARMTERVVRDVDVVTGEEKAVISDTREAAVNAVNDRTIESVEVVSSSNAGDLESAVTSHGQNSVVFVDGSYTVTSAVTLAEGQTLIGGDTDLPIYGAATGVQLVFNAGAGAGGISGSVSGTGVVNLGEDGVLGGLTINNTSAAAQSHGVLIHGANGATVFGNTISGGSNGISQGVYILASDDARILGNTISGQGRHGIFFDESDRGIVVLNEIQTTNSNSHGVIFYDSHDGEVSGNTIGTSGIDGYGVQFFDSARGKIVDNEITTSNATGIEFFQSVDGEASGNEILVGGNTKYGIYFTTGSTGGLASWNDITTSGTQAHGIYFSASGNGEASDNTVTTPGNFSNGIYLTNSSNMNVLRNTISIGSNNSRGILVAGSGPGTLTFSNIRIADNIFHSSALAEVFGVNGTATMTFEFAAGSDGNRRSTPGALLCSLGTSTIVGTVGFDDNGSGVAVTCP